MKMLVLSSVLATFAVTLSGPVMAQDATRNAQIAAILKAGGMEFVTRDLKTLDFAEEAQDAQPAATDQNS
ncbi:hypothetical protein [Thioclava kandeliae]|uniref:Uncharacterized protein n=2 Tax=Thioclava TaxID=285107 RepID=A0ABV1SGU7_9RHOB